jgi:hypothetical protein
LKNGWWQIPPEPDEGQSILDDIAKSTLGTLFRDLQNLVKFEGDLPTLFFSAIKTRNKLMHGFYERHDFKIQSDEGRDAMLADLEKMHRELFNAWQLAGAMHNPVFLKLDELTNYDSFDDKRLQQMRRTFEKIPIIVAGPKLAAFVERQWPSLAKKICRVDLQGPIATTH